MIRFLCCFILLAAFSLSHAQDLVSKKDKSKTKLTNTFTSNLEEVNTKPEISDQEFTVAENSAKETVVGTITASDADNDDLTFKILSIDPEGEVNDWYQNFNGSFEDMDMTNNPYTGAGGLFYDGPENDPVQAYYEADFVPGWQTDDVFDVIEMFQNGYSVDGTSFIAYEGTQWAELNAESFSALYFDMTIQPGTTMTWRFAHRARRSSGTNLDCLRLRIGSVDARISDLPEIDTFCSAQVNDESNKPDNASGTSDGWVIYEGTYVVPEGQYYTRFAYEAISSSGGSAVEGNFIDGVEFYSQPDTTKAFSLDTTTGELNVNNLSKLDFETTPIFNIEVEVSDGILSDTAIVTVNLSDGADMALWQGNSWSPSAGPQPIDHAVILGEYSFDKDERTELEVADLEVYSGGSLVVASDQLLKVNGDLINNGELIIESGGTLLTYESNSVFGNDIIIKRNTRYADGKYSFVGSPVAASEISGSDLGTIVYQYNEQTPYGSNDGLSRWEDALEMVLVPGKGYAQAGQQEITFAGTPNTGTIVYTGTYTVDTDDSNEGWNLVANPYPAAISVADFLNGNANIDDLYAAVYIWDDNGSDEVRGSNSDYIVANLSGVTQTTPAGGATRYNEYLGSGQGFFVKLAATENTTVEFTESMRSESNNADDNFFRKDAERQQCDIRINLTNDQGLFRQTLVVVTEGIEDQTLNRGYDAKIMNVEQSDAVFSYKLGESLAIQTISEAVESIPLGMHVQKKGTYRLSVETDKEGPILLRDHQMNKVIDLSANDYKFQASDNQLIERFELLLVSNILGEGHEAKLSMYPNPVDELLYLNVPSEDIQEIQLYTLDGAKFKTLSPDTTGANLSAVPAGTYVLLVETKSGQTYSEKLVVRH